MACWEDWPSLCRPCPRLLSRNTSLVDKPPDVGVAVSVSIISKFFERTLDATSRRKLVPRSHGPPNSWLRTSGSAVCHGRLDSSRRWIFGIRGAGRVVSPEPPPDSGAPVRIDPQEPTPARRPRSMMAVLAESGIALSVHTIRPMATSSSTICVTMNGQVRAVGL